MSVKIFSHLRWIVLLALQRRAVHAAHFADSSEIAVHERQQIVNHLALHRRIELLKQRRQLGVIGVGHFGEIQRLVDRIAVKQERVLIGLDADQDRHHDLVLLAEHELDLRFRHNRTFASRIGIQTPNCVQNHPQTEKHGAQKK